MNQFFIIPPSGHDRWLGSKILSAERERRGWGKGPERVDEESDGRLMDEARPPKDRGQTQDRGCSMTEATARRQHCIHRERQPPSPGRVGGGHRGLNPKIHTCGSAKHRHTDPENGGRRSASADLYPQLDVIVVAAQSVVDVNAIIIGGTCLGHRPTDGGVGRQRRDNRKTK